MPTVQEVLKQSGLTDEQISEAKIRSMTLIVVGMSSHLLLALRYKIYPEDYEGDAYPPERTYMLMQKYYRDHRDKNISGRTEKYRYA